MRRANMLTTGGDQATMREAKVPRQAGRSKTKNNGRHREKAKADTAKQMCDMPRKCRFCLAPAKNSESLRSEQAANMQ
jgi:hypothetical protein